MNAMTPITFAIRDLQTGCDIISRIPLANPQQAAIDLDRFLDSLLHSSRWGNVFSVA